MLERLEKAIETFDVCYIMQDNKYLVGDRRATKKELLKIIPALRNEEVWWDFHNVLVDKARVYASDFWRVEAKQWEANPIGALD